MTDLKFAVEEQGFTVIHIKTDSIKIADPTPEILDFVVKMGELYGYQFETEAIFDRICLVNDAVYIYHCTPDSPEDPENGLQQELSLLFHTYLRRSSVMMLSNLTTCVKRSLSRRIYIWT